MPTFGVTIKMHKENKPRFMGKTHGTTLTQLSQWISRTLKAMIPQSEQIWRNVFMSAGIVTTGSWVIWNSKQVRQRMSRMQNMSMHYNNQQTYDFSTMYTKLKLNKGDGEEDGMEEKLRRYAKIVFEQAKQCIKPFGVVKVLVIKRKGLNTAPWEPADPKPKDSRNKKVVTEKRLNRWIKYLVDNLYVEVGNKVMRQAFPWAPTAHPS